MTKTALVFPGQGSQIVGMGKELVDAFPIAREVFEEIDDILKEKLSQIIFEGPEDKLMLTANTQPALMAVSIAIMRVIEKETKKGIKELCAYAAGHSLGEYTALTAAKSLRLKDCTYLLRVRGLAMQKAVPVGQGGMAALIGVDLEQAMKITKQVTNDICEVANDNGGGQVVLSGTKKGVEQAMAIANEQGVKRVIELPVSAPFHSSLMQSAAERMQEAFGTVEVKAPVVPIIANITAGAVTEPEQIKKYLVQQVTGTVRWRETIENLAQDGVTKIIEIGSGKVLSGLTRRINRELETQSIQGPADIEAWIKSL